MMDGDWIGKDVEGRGHVLIEGIILTLPGRTGGKIIKNPSG